MHFVTHNYALLTTGPSAFVFVVTTVVDPERLQSKARLWYKSLRKNIHLSINKKMHRYLTLMVSHAT